MPRRALSKITSCLAAVALLSGCAHTNTENVTPWFRVSVHHPASTIIAESGGPKPSSRAEHLANGNWVLVSHASEALSVASGARVLYLTDSDGGAQQNEVRWMDRDGRNGRFACQSQIFARQKGANELLCLELDCVGAHQPPTGVPVPFSLRWVDAGGVDIRPRQELLLPPDPYESYEERHLLGFVRGEPLLQVTDPRNTTPTDYFPGRECTYFVLGAEGLRAIGRPFLVDKHAPYVAPEHERCDEPEVLRQALPGITIEPAATFFARGDL